MLSIGGATYTEGGFSTSDAAVSAANNIWSIFGPYSASAVRPFGTSVVDGFDFDFESTVSNMYVEFEISRMIPTLVLHILEASAIRIPSQICSCSRN